jgi:hypothetical protein
VSETRYTYACCDVCLREERPRTALGSEDFPKGWLQVCSSDGGKTLWDICGACATKLKAWVVERIREATP